MTVDLQGTAAMYSGGQLTQEAVFDNVNVSLTGELLGLFVPDMPSDDALISAIPKFVIYLDSNGKALPVTSVVPLSHGANGRVFSIRFVLESGQDIWFVLKLQKMIHDWEFNRAQKNAVACADMQECGLVRYRTWMYRGTGVDVKVKATLMEKMNSDLHDEFFESRARPPTPHFLQRLAEFLLGVKACLKKHETSFADLNPMNIGVNRHGTTVFRLIDLDSIGVHVATRPYLLVPRLGERPFYYGHVEHAFFSATTVFSMLAIAAMACVLGSRDATVNPSDAKSEVENLLYHRTRDGLRDISIRTKVDMLTDWIRETADKIKPTPNRMLDLATECRSEIYRYFERNTLYNWDAVPAGS